MALTFLLWNARSLLRKTAELQTYLRDSLPSVVGLCETWLPPHLALNLQGYSIFRRDRQQGRGGGVLLALRDGLQYSPLPLPQWPGGHLEVVAARVSLLRGSLTVAVIYNPGGAASSQELEHYIASLPPPVIIMGDFNAHHQCWEPDLPPLKRNPSGNTLFQIMLDSPHLSLLSPPGLATRFHPHTGASSVLDLFIGDPAFNTSTFSTGPYMGSDHLPVLASVPQAPPKQHPGCLPRWRLTSSEWPRYREALQTPPDITTLTLDDAASSFHQTLETAGAAAFHLTTRRTPRRPGKPWWNDDCARAVLARRRAWNQWRRTPTILAGTTYRRLDALCTKTILKAQRKAWDSHCSSLSFSSPTKRTWDFLHSMEGKKARRHIPLTDGARSPLEDPQKAEALAHHYHQRIGVPPSLHPPADLHRAASIAIASPGIPNLAQPFTRQELDVALSKLKAGKAAGKDNIPYDFLTHLTSPIQDCLLLLYNSSWETRRYPNCWKPSVLIPIPKPGKDPTLPSSYRPIALLSCIGKLMERLVSTRLSWWLEEKLLLREEQCGFRPHRGTVDVLGQLEYHVCDTYRQHQVMTTIFIDLEGAFDTAPHEGILYKLAGMGITGATLAWVQDFLAGRSYQVAVGASLSHSRPIRRGVPQGSILSPLLFNVLLSDLRIPSHSHLLLYADDISIVSRAPTLAQAQTHLQEAANSLGEWMNIWGLKVSAPKSTLMCFTLKRLPSPPTLQLSGQAVPYSRTHTFLGLRLDGPRLSWAGHIEHLKTSCNRRLDVMKRIAGIRWGANRDLLLKYYLATIRPKIMYGSSIYGSAARTVLTRLDPLQNAALRISMGAMKSSPVISLQAESGILPLSAHRREVLCQHYHRIMCLPSAHPLASLYRNSGVDHHTPVWSPGVRQPLLVRALQALIVIDLPPPPAQPTSPHSPFPPWLDINYKFTLHLPGLPSRHSAGCLAAALFTQIDRTIYHHHIKLFTDGSHSPSLPSTAAAVYDPANSICRTWRLPPETDVLSSELYALHQAFIHLNTSHTKGKAVIYTDSLSSLHLLLSRHPQSTTSLVHVIQRALLHLTTEGWDISLQWVPSHNGIPGNEVADTAARMALTAVNTTPFPLPLSTATSLISRVCHSAWNNSLGNALRNTSMGHYRNDSSPQPWIRQKSRVLDVTLTRLRLGHTTLTAHLHRLRLSPDPDCPWCRNVSETIEHFLLQCPRFHSHRVVLQSQLLALGVNTFDLPTLLAAAGVHPSRQHAVIRLTCAFLRRTAQLPRL